MRYLDKLEEGAAKKEKLSPKQYRNLMTAVSRVKSVEREASGSEPSDAFSRGVKKGAKGEILRQHERKKKKALGEAKKRFYTKDEVDAYARGREKATIERRKKEFEDFKDGVIRKSKEEKKKKLKAEAYIHLGDVLAEAILGEARVNKKIEKSTKAMGRYLRGDRRDDQTPETARGRAIKAGEDLTSGQKRASHKEALALKTKNKKKRVAEKLRTSANKTYKSAEVGEASGESAESVKKKSAKAHKRMSKAQEIEDKS